MKERLQVQELSGEEPVSREGWQDLGSVEVGGN